MATDYSMSEPSQPDFWMEVQKATPGFFGAMGATLLVQRPQNRMEFIAAMIGGTATAYFVGPFAANWMGWSTPEGQSAMGFGLGMCGVALMPGIVRRVQLLIGMWNGTWPPSFQQQKDDSDGP
jgi:hypothetical protein